jgi:hypothetical protein
MCLKDHYNVNRADKNPLARSTFWIIQKIIQNVLHRFDRDIGYCSNNGQ